MKKYIYLLALLVVTMYACRKDNNETGKPPLSVKSFWPNSGNSGTIVTINGQGFGAKTNDNEVSFGNTEAIVVDVRDTMLTVLAPKDGTTGTISVKVGDKKLELGTYTYQSLSIRSVSPLNGPAGTNISIKGEGFSSLDAPAEVTINGKSAIVTAVNDTLVIAAIPEAAGSGKIVVKVNGKEVSGPDFAFQRISDIKPLTGGAGTKVTINGEGFSATATDNIVAFNGKRATVLSGTSNQLIVQAPADVATGPVSVAVNGQKTIGNTFTVVPFPVLKAVTPLSGPAGVEMIIKGENFSAIADEVAVMINGKAATITTVSDKQIVLKVPESAGTGKVEVTVNDQTTAGPIFKEQALSVTKISPDNGVEGTQVTITGLGFSATAADNIVLFNGIVVPVIAATETTLTVKVPTGAKTGAIEVRVNGLEAIGPVFTKSGVITLAGGPTQDIFSFPNAITIDRSGNVFVADGNKIFKVTPSGTATLFAGDAAAGFADGVGTQARFNYINTLGIDKQDNVYAADQQNKRIRKIAPDGTVSTYAQLSFTPTGLGVDQNDFVYVGMQYQSVAKLDKLGNATVMARSYESPTSAIAIDNAGIVYFGSDYSYNSIFKIQNGERTTYAGGGYGYKDGPLSIAQFGQPIGVVYDPSENKLFTIDNNAVRMLFDGNVTTITGWKGAMQPSYGYQDGALSEAMFNGITALCIDKDGNIYVCERGNKAVRKIVLK